MEFRENQLDYWKNEVPEMVDELYELFSADFDHFKYSSSYRDFELIKEKPEYISDRIWSHFFITSDYVFKQLRQELVSICWLEINGYKIGTFDGWKGLYFVFDAEITSDYVDNDSIDYKVRSRFTSYSQELFSKESLIVLYNVAKEIYGDKNVCLTKLDVDSEFCHFNNYSGPKFYLVIKHDDFWCSDSFGLNVKIIGGITIIPIKSNGQMYTADPFQFSVYKRDWLLHSSGYHQSHVPHRESLLVFPYVCKGDGSPLNQALSAYLSDPTDDTVVYNVFLNYNNLLEKEDEEGVPYCYIRRNILKSVHNDGSRQMSYNELMEAVKDRNIDYSVDVKNYGLRVNFGESDINKYISEINESSDSNVYIDKKEHEAYKKELKNINRSTEYRGYFKFFDQDCDVEILRHDPIRFDLSGMTKDHPKWTHAGITCPNNNIIRLVKNKVNTLVNSKLIQISNVNKIKHEEQEELIGLKKVQRNSNVENLLQTV